MDKPAYVFVVFGPDDVTPIKFYPCQYSEVFEIRERLDSMGYRENFKYLFSADYIGDNK
jgi:hypothetical protein